MPTELVLALVGAVAIAAFLLGRFAGRRTTAASGTPLPRASSQAPVDYSDRFVPADRLGIGLVVLDEQRRIVASNATAEALLGSRAGGLQGKSTMEAFVDHTVEELIADASAAGSAAAEIAIAGEPQRRLDLHAWTGSTGVWVALVDVSELRRLQRIRTEFVDNLSHELRTPLTTVRLLTESLALEAERTEVPERLRESIAKIDVETGHLAQMVSELLDLATIEQGNAPLGREIVELDELVDETLGRLRTYADQQGVRLTSEAAGERSERAVIGDGDRIAQVLANIVHNAIKFSPPSGEVVVRVQPDASNVVVEVEDHGPGIARADRSRIFERFYKADRARSRGRGGTGLGLSIARHIVERHGGHIWVQSEEGRGSRFFVSLPRAHPAGSAGP